MTATARAVVVCVILVVFGALAAASILADSGNTTAAVSAFTGLAGTVLGYVFGDKNGEKRLSAALVETYARTGNPAAAIDHAARIADPSRENPTDIDRGL